VYLKVVIHIIHTWDTHAWSARLPDGSWISAYDYSSNDPIFQQATRIRIEPIDTGGVQAILDCAIPEGYTAFLRTDIHRDMASEEIAKLGYIMALEKGTWPDPGIISLDSVPLVDGFRAELQTWDGCIDFISSSNFSYEIETIMGIDVYKFIKLN
jgi:hypothetical protein